MGEKGQEWPRRSTGVFFDIHGLCRFWDLSHAPLLSVCVNMLWPNVMARDDRRLVASLWPRTHTRNWQSSSEFRGGILPIVERHFCFLMQRELCLQSAVFFSSDGVGRADAGRTKPGPRLAWPGALEVISRKMYWGYRVKISPLRYLSW